jgi:hypothetical protein
MQDTDKKFTIYGDNVQLPTEPLGPGVKGPFSMDYTAIFVPSKDKTYYEILVWNENTAKSVLYYYNYTDKVFKAYEDNVQLPSNPIGSFSGKICMDYTSVHVPSKEKTYYEVLIYDSYSGKSTLYFYSYEDKKFKAYGGNTQFPGRPLGE